MNDETISLRNIGRYQVLHELGRGAMGVVYCGFDPVIRRTVALKTIAFASDDAESKSLRDRLYREAAAAGTLAHPNIVTIYDIIDDGATTAVAMELVEGQTLADLLVHRGALPLDEALDVFEQICGALDYAGSKGIVHRDIKPANILLTADGRPKVMDFGIARIAMQGQTQTSTIMGSPSYMSPEQVRGLPLDPRSDLFSAAVVFFEMVAGQRPFGGDDVATTMYRIVNEPPRSLDHLVANVSPAAVSVLEWALSKSPADRYQTGSELVAALRQAIRTGAVVAGPAPEPVAVAVPTPVPAGPVVAGVRRPPLLVYGVIGSAVLLVLVVLAIVLGGGFGQTTTTSSVGPGGGGPTDLAGGAASVPGGVDAAASGGTAIGTPSTDTAASRGAIQPGHEATTDARTGATPPPARPGERTETLVVTTAPARGRSGATPSGGDAAAAAALAAALAARTGAPAEVTVTTRTSPPADAPGARTTPTPPSPAARAVAPPAEPAAGGAAVIRVGFDGPAYPVSLFSGDALLGRVEGGDGTVSVEPGAVSLRAVNDAVFLNADLGTVSLRPGERRTVPVPGLASAVFGVKGEDYAGVRVLLDGKQLPGPYPAQLGKIASGVHRVTYRWISGPASGREVAGVVTMTSGGHFIVRAATDSPGLIVQQLR